MTTARNGERQPHLPVLYQTIIHALQPASPGKYVDATVGAGGHAWGILRGKFNQMGSCWVSIWTLKHWL